MKSFKITLAVIVIGAMGAGVFFWIQSIKSPGEVIASENAFIAKINEETEKLKNRSAMSFCRDFYYEIEYEINAFYKPSPPNHPYGRFGKTQLENDQSKKNLEITLNSVYAEKFIEQAFYVFSKPEWRKNDLSFIQSEKSRLEDSPFVESNGPVDKDFTKIQQALNKYNEIEDFITSCNNFSYLGNELSNRFPSAEVQEKIQRATQLRKSNLENNHVNKCIRLHNGLKKIPENLFRKHTKYLENKIDHWSDMYSYYISQSDYSNNLYKPIKSEIEGLDNDLYNVSNFESEYYRLIHKWSTDNTNAYNYEYNDNTNE